MNQSLHLLLVDLARANVLVTWPRARWLLPILNLPERLRPGQHITAWAGLIGLRARMVGQWLGRPSPNGSSMDWLAVAEAIGGSLNVGAGSFCWQPIHDLRSPASWVEYQQWALTEVSAHGALPSVPGPFGTSLWLYTVETWVAEVLGTSVIEATPYRTSAYEVAVGFTTKVGRVFFKGLSADRGREARAAFDLCKATEGNFAPTLAFRTQADGSIWWLTDECPGTQLADDLTAESVARVAAACGRLQRAASRDIPDVVARLPWVDISELTQWGRALLRTSSLSVALEAPDRSIEQACATVSSIGVESFIHVDLDPSNVFVRGDEVRFIDLNEMHCGPLPLIASMFAGRLVRSIGGPCDHRDMSRAVYHAYEQAWTPSSGLNHLWPALEIVSALFVAHLGWTRVQAKVRHGEVRDVDDLVRSVLAGNVAKALLAGGAHLRR